MESKLKVAVVGTGSLGKEHVRIYAELARAGRIELAGVHDIATDAAERAAQRYSTKALRTLTETLGAADAFSIVTPTSTHHAIAKQLLEHKKHVLVEKPMTENGVQAQELVALAQRIGCVLQVGHVERFNPVFQYLEKV